MSRPIPRLKALLVVLGGAFGLSLTGCIQMASRSSDPRLMARVHRGSSEEFQRLFTAARSVLGESYRIDHEDPTNGMIWAKSEVEPGGLTKYRRVVWVRIDRNRFGGFEVREVRVNREADMSFARNRGMQPSYDWVSLEFDHAEEARILREIHARVEMPPATSKPSSPTQLAIRSTRV